MEYGTIIDRLEEEIRQYRVEFQRFFNGDTQIPPEDQGLRIRKRLTSLTGAPQLSAVDRFRLSGLESRYNSLVELFRRRLREAQHIQRARSAEGRDASTAAVVDLGTEDGQAKIDTLYEAIYGQDGAIRPEAFRDYLTRQAAKVRQRTGCDKVRFTVRDEDGKPRLKARPLRTGKPE